MVVAKMQHIKPETENTLGFILSKLYCGEVNESSVCFNYL